MVYYSKVSYNTVCDDFLIFFNSLLQEKRMSVLGGSTLKHAVKFILDTSLSNAVLQKFNWEGKQCWRTKENLSKRDLKQQLYAELWQVSLTELFRIYHPSNSKPGVISQQTAVQILTKRAVLWTLVPPLFQGKKEKNTILSFKVGP